MADQDEKKNAEEIPAFRISEKKVDDSWKEEARREREAAAKANVSAKSAKPAESARSKAVASEESVKAAPSPAADGQPEGEQFPTTEAVPEGKPLTAAEQQQSKIFMNFLAGLAQQALMQMGEIENPYTGQRDVDLNSARYTLELLSVVQQRTQGNLVGDEAQMLEETLGELKMRYVQMAQEMQRQMAAQMAKGAGGPGGPGAGVVPGPGFGRRK